MKIISKRGRQSAAKEIKHHDLGVVERSCMIDDVQLREGDRVLFTGVQERARDRWQALPLDDADYISSYACDHVQQALSEIIKSKRKELEAVGVIFHGVK